jgi:hypothetical protein
LSSTRLPLPRAALVPATGCASRRQKAASARAQLNESLAPNVVCGQHGRWQACPEIGAPGYDPFGPEGANFNLIIGNAAIDPVSGSVPHRAYLCQFRRVG